MEKKKKYWVCGLLAGIVLLLALCAAAVYFIDPCFYYRMPENKQGVFFNERYQMAGIVKNVQADTVIMGTSMTANYHSDDAEDVFGGSAVRVTIPDGYFSEFDQTMNALFRSQTPKRIIFGLDMNLMIRDEEELTGAMPEYLYNCNPLDDIKYLLNKDSLYYSAYVLLADRWGESKSLSEGFAWDDRVWWNHATALNGYHRPELAEVQLPAEKFTENVQNNLAVIDQWVNEHPDTEFDFFLSPYSILFWDKNIRLGRMDAMYSALEQTCQTLEQYDNVKLYGFLMDREMVENLDNYGDYIHHSGKLGKQVLNAIAEDQDRLTPANTREILANWQEFVIHYDYEKFWDVNFWLTWNEQHPAA